MKEPGYTEIIDWQAVDDNKTLPNFSVGQEVDIKEVCYLNHQPSQALLMIFQILSQTVFIIILKIYGHDRHYDSFDIIATFMTILMIIWYHCSDYHRHLYYHKDCMIFFITFILPQWCSSPDIACFTITFF